MSENKIEIDRKTPFTFASVGSEMTDRYCEIMSEDPESKALTSLDLSRLSLEILLEVNQVKPTDINEQILENKTRLKNEGFIFLDAKVMETLVCQPKWIPQEWISICDTDSYNEKSGGIRFDGTIFKDRQTGEEQVMGPLFNRGFWSCGFSSLFFPERDLQFLIRSEGLVNMREYTAVLRPS